MSNTDVTAIDYTALAAAVCKLGGFMGGSLKAPDVPAVLSSGEKAVGEVGGGATADAELSDSSSGGEVGVVSEGVRRSIIFGGMADAHAGVVPEPVKGYYAVVRERNTDLLGKFVAAKCGAKLPKKAMPDLALCTYAAATMPAVFRNGKERLRTLGAVGDAVMTAHVAVAALASGKNVESTQALRTAYTNNAVLRRKMLQFGLDKYITYPSGTTPESTGITDNAFEAIVGVIALYRSAQHVQRYLEAIGILDQVVDM